jgi:transposase
MSKHRYHAIELKQVDWGLIAEQTVGQERVVFAVDVAKDDFVGGLMGADRGLVEMVKWTHPQQTRALVEAVVTTFGAARLEVVMEPSGTYGDALRALFVDAGVKVYRISPKRVHDAAELYDGVPSLHDAKAAYLIGRLHWEGVSQPWVEPSASRRALTAQLGLLELYQERWQRSLNRLEALLSRHWPEAIRILDLGSVSLLTVLGTYGDAAQVAAHAEDAAVLMQEAGRAGLSRETIEQLLDSARHTVGLACIEAERQALRVLAQDMLDTHQALRQVERVLAGEVKADPALERMAAVVGKTTTAVLSSTLGSAQSYLDAASYLKSAGLNLKERSSGKHQGQLKITKRGPSVARRYLYLATLRWIIRDPQAAEWYRRKVQRDGGLKGKAIIALTRKLTKALWHVARGERFDSAKLFHRGAPAMAT